MAKIELGNFGTSTTEIAPQARTDVVGAAVEDLGNTIQYVARKRDEERAQQQAAIASNNLLDHELKNQKIVTDIQTRLASGDLPPEEAQAEYQQQSSENTLPQVDHLHPAAAEAYTRGARRVTAEGGFKVDALANVARQFRFKDQWGTARDSIEKLAGAPGTTPEATQKLIEQLDTFVPVGRAAGLNQADLAKDRQDSVDRIWLNNAVQRAVENHDNMAGLRVLQADLSKKGGLYENKLDVNKRNAVLAQVGNRIDTIQAHLEHVADRRETDGMRVLGEVDRQIASTVPATADQWALWGTRVAGTSSAEEFNSAVEQEQKIQDVLKLAPAEQAAYVAKVGQELYAGGGSVRAQMNYNRLSTAVQRNSTMMQQAPLAWLQQRVGLEVPPLDFTQVLAPGGQAALAAQVKQRTLDIATAQTQYGPQIQNRPLLQPEAQQLTGILAAAKPDQAVELFQGLHAIAGDDKTYNAMVSQFAPDQPVLALAGLRAAQDPKVASFIIQGNTLLNASKAQKAEDGKPNVSLYVPSDSAFQQSFSDAVGTTFRNHQGAAETAYQAVKSYYAGKAVHDGKVLEQSGVPDPTLLKESIAAVVGTVVDYNGKGEVAAPWGMDKSTFNDRVSSAWASAARRYPELSNMAGAQLSQIGLTNADTEGQYLVPANGGFLSVVRGKQVVPIVLDLNAPDAINPPEPPKRVITDPRTGHVVSQ